MSVSFILVTRWTIMPIRIDGWGSRHIIVRTHAIPVCLPVKVKAYAPGVNRLHRVGAHRRRKHLILAKYPPSSVISSQAHFDVEVTPFPKVGVDIVQDIVGHSTYPKLKQTSTPASQAVFCRACRKDFRSCTACCLVTSDQASCRDKG